MTRRRTSLLVLAMAGLLALPGCSVLGRGGDSYEVDAEFTRAIGVYPGSPVRQLGIEVGQITDVQNDGDVVRVSMQIEDDAELSSLLAKAAPAASSRLSPRISYWPRACTPTNWECPPETSKARKGNSGAGVSSMGASRWPSI